MIRIISVRRARKNEEFDQKFENGEDISQFLDFSVSLRPGQEQKRVNVDFPVWMIHMLDKEARKIGVTRESIIKVWLAERLKETVS